MPKAVASPAPKIERTDGEDGCVRAVIDAVLPNVDGGRFAVKRVAGEALRVQAHCFADGHDVLRVMLRWRPEADADWTELPMKPLGNDVWEAEFAPPAIGRYRYTVTAWVDAFESWRHDMARRIDPEDIRIASQMGAQEIAGAAGRAKGADAQALSRWSSELKSAAIENTMEATALKAFALDEALCTLAERYPDRRLATHHPVELPLVADRDRARFSTWYELFPRSTAPEGDRHGTFRDVEARLPAIAAMGFDVLYFPPIHPVGRIQRKGKNNALAAQPGDVGSPWAIGAEEGGHKSILPELGTREDFQHLRAEAQRHGLEIALDIAFQCAPDHPYVKAHPSWFRWRPDGTVQYAENPPKKYQDIYPFNFETEDWQGLWTELKSVFEHWIGEGVKIFRVDNPHTKAFPFWEWAITELKREHPDALFLAEAFTRPKVMHRLAEVGFTLSYSYFPWRVSGDELRAYFTELSTPPSVDRFRPSAWPTTPDILPWQLMDAPLEVFAARAFLAATLCPSYGIYGPSFELGENEPAGNGKEEFAHSEKYEVRTWDRTAGRSLRGLLTDLNRIRTEQRALHTLRTLRFHGCDNDRLLCYAKTSHAGPSVDPDDRADSTILVVANVFGLGAEAGTVDLDLVSLGLDPDREFQVHDLMTDRTFTWSGPRNYVELHPDAQPGHVFRVCQA